MTSKRLGLPAGSQQLQINSGLCDCYGETETVGTLFIILYRKRSG